MRVPVDLHPDDAAHRHQLAQQLRATRRHLGLSQDAVAAQSGIDQSGLSRLERGAASMYIATLQRYARTLNLHAVLDLPNIPPAQGVEASMWRHLAAVGDPDRAEAAQRQLCLATMVAHRRWLGLRQQDLAERMGVCDSAHTVIERGVREPLLATYQRFARALGSALTVELVPAKQDVAVAA